VSLGELLIEARAAAEALMVDTCTITRQGDPTTDPDTGVVTPDPDTIYAGRCRVQQARAVGQRTDTGQVSVVMLRLELQIPTSVTGVAEGDDVVVDTSVHDPDLPGRRFRVRDLAHKSHASARRIGCEEVT
jgi:hypothetical protein